MDDYVERMINEFPMKISNIDTYLTPDGDNIYISKLKSKVWIKKKLKSSILQ